MEWFELLTNTINFKQNYRYEFAKIKLGDNWSMFDYSHSEADFVYLDGPPVDQLRYYNRDIIEMLEGGLTPKVIVFDVRRETVNQTLDYIHINSIPYKLVSPLPGDRRHTILELTNASARN